ncbi:MAG: STAS domain-containing protein [Bacteroidaceae bacterium]|nr:STAS domain-containing protein [Bacteroidaceae bacterium]
MEVTINNEGDKLVAVLQGRLDTASAAQFSNDIAPLIQQAEKTIVLDCKELEFISSSGLRLFLNLRKATMSKGGSVTIKNVSNEIKQIFTITGFTSLFQFE